MDFFELATRTYDRAMCVRDGHDWVRIRARLGGTVVIRTQCYRCRTVQRVEAAWNDVGSVA
jgi:hypothetical protein